MKKLILIISGVAIAHTGFSQISIDPEVGLNISNLKLKSDLADVSSSDAAVGFSVGAGVNINLTKGLYLKPGVAYHMLGGKHETMGITNTTTLHYLRVPVNLGYNYTISDKAGSVFAEAGPYVGLALSGQIKTEGLPGGEVKKDIEFGDGITESNAFDWGFNFAIGYESPWGVYIKGGYGLGLGNLNNTDDIKTTNNHWNVGLGYRIKL